MARRLSSHASGASSPAWHHRAARAARDGIISLIWLRLRVTTSAATHWPRHPVTHAPRFASAPAPPPRLAGETDSRPGRRTSVSFESSSSPELGVPTTADRLLCVGRSGVRIFRARASAAALARGVCPRISSRRSCAERRAVRNAAVSSATSGAWDGRCTSRPGSLRPPKRGCAASRRPRVASSHALRAGARPLSEAFEPQRVHVFWKLLVEVVEHVFREDDISLAIFLCFPLVD